MAQKKVKLKCVSEQQLAEVVENELNYVRVSFQNETEPVFLVYGKSRPSGEEISNFLKTSLLIFEEKFTLTWGENNRSKSNN